MDIIDLNRIDFDTIKQDLDNFLRKLSTFNEIQETIPASTIDLLERVTASYAVYLAQKLRRTREEFYLSTATLDTSIYNFVYMFGYNINRYTAPELKIQYRGRETISLEYGDILGKYNDLEVVYTGSRKKYEQGDILESVSIGVIKEYTKNKSGFSNIEKVEINPEQLKSINNSIALFIDDIQQYIISRNPEDYLLNKMATEFSTSKYSTNVYLFDKDSNFGIDVNLINESYTIKYLETNGYDAEFDLNQVSLNDLDNFICLGVYHLGSFGDDLKKVKNLIPYYYHTMRRAVTVSDYTYITLANPLFKDVYYQREEGVKGIKRIKIVDASATTYNIKIYGTPYLVTIDSSDSMATRYQKIYDVIKNNALIKASITDEYIEIENVNTRLDFDNSVWVDEPLMIEDIRKNVKPICCTMLCYYIKYNTVDDPILFTDKEQKDISDYLMKYQMIGTNVIFLPAKKLEKDLRLLIKVDKASDIDKINREVNEIIDSYELQLRKSFYYGELLAKIGAIPEVLFVLPQQEPYDVELDGKYYLKFNREIEIEVME